MENLYHFSQGNLGFIAAPKDIGPGGLGSKGFALLPGSGVAQKIQFCPEYQDAPAPPLNIFLYSSRKRTAKINPIKTHSSIIAENE